MISDEQIKKFQAIYKARFSKYISREEALEQGTRLLRLVELVYKPMTEDELKTVQKRRKETSRD